MTKFGFLKNLPFISSDLCLNHVFENPALVSSAPYCWVVSSVRASATKDRQVAKKPVPSQSAHRTVTYREYYTMLYSYNLTS